MLQSMGSQGVGHNLAIKQQQWFFQSSSSNPTFHKVSIMEGEVHELTALNYSGRQILHACSDRTGVQHLSQSWEQGLVLFPCTFDISGSFRTQVSSKYLLFLIPITHLTAYSSPPTSRQNISLSYCCAFALACVISLIPPTFNLLQHQGLL